MEVKSLQGSQRKRDSKEGSSKSFSLENHDIETNFCLKYPHSYQLKFTLKRDGMGYDLLLDYLRNYSLT